MNRPNPLLSLDYEPALESLGDDYFDEVSAAEFPQHVLRYRGDRILPQIGLDAAVVTDADFIAAFGKFQGREPLLALRYHGYQFGEYNPFLGDGRGFLYGQVRGVDGELYDFGTKGSGTTPYSRGGDGRLTLKGGVREVLAAEALHYMGVRTSRCFSLIETGEQLWRGDEPSPARSSVMVRFSRSHIRFGTFERLHYLKRPDLIKRLLDHAIEYYYPHLWGQPDVYALFYAELVQRVAELTAQWMAAGFCHGVLNTDNMSITGESFDYGPYAFIPTYEPLFTAAYFDYCRRYCYEQQPNICQWNLEMLQKPLKAVIHAGDLEIGLAKFDEYYLIEYRKLTLKKLGLADANSTELERLLQLTLRLLRDTQILYHQFFIQLTESFSPDWREDVNSILFLIDFLPLDYWDEWRKLYHRILAQMPEEEMENVLQRLRQVNPNVALLRPVIESVWEPITNEDDWEPFYALVRQIQGGK
jgi:uncharacterized protein YdiU (UPF0061 family)